jgi:hypothetical protein
MKSVNAVVRGGFFAAALVVGSSVYAGGSLPIATTALDFDMPGTQPVDLTGPGNVQITGASDCKACHLGNDRADETLKPWRWRGSVHAHAARDPLFRAAVAIANQDATGSGELCFRCHAPKGWLAGRAQLAADGSALLFEDVDEGVGCNVCHRMVDRIYDAGVNPVEDAAILSGIAAVPPSWGNVTLVIDPQDRRRGPFSDAVPPHDWLYSPHHQTADLCGTCHDVSNPVLSRVGGVTPASSDTYAPNALGAEHPSHITHDMFPEQRTYSEWLNSAYATPGGLSASDASDPYDLDDRFGGNSATVGKCQDCHMQDETGEGCWDIFEPPVRNDLPQHDFSGGNKFMLELVEHVNSEDFDVDTMDQIARAKIDAVAMLGKATDTYSWQNDCDSLNVRVVNQCGHKLLTGYPEGRRIWVNVQWFGPGDVLIGEQGAYDPVTAVLTTVDTKVYETKMGLDASMAATTGLPAGKSFHLVLNNSLIGDNRIPPRGFTNAAFEAVQAGHAGYAYTDGQHWDDTQYTVPPGSVNATVTVYYQTASKEYIEFLDTANTTTTDGSVLAAAWAAVGKSTPIVMDTMDVVLAQSKPPADVNMDGIVDVNDISYVLFRLGMSGTPSQVDGDANYDGVVDVNDISYVLFRLGNTCP